MANDDSEVRRRSPIDGSSRINNDPPNVVTPLIPSAGGVPESLPKARGVPAVCCFCYQWLAVANVFSMFWAVSAVVLFAYDWSLRGGYVIELNSEMKLYEPNFTNPQVAIHVNDLLEQMYWKDLFEQCIIGIVLVLLTLTASSVPFFLNKKRVRSLTNEETSDSAVSLALGAVHALHISLSGVTLAACVVFMFRFSLSRFRSDDPLVEAIAAVLREGLSTSTMHNSIDFFGVKPTDSMALTIVKVGTALRRSSQIFIQILFCLSCIVFLQLFTMLERLASPAAAVVKSALFLLHRFYSRFRRRGDAQEVASIELSETFYAFSCDH